MSRRNVRPSRAEPTWPDWLLESLSALRPPDRLLPSEWADKNRILDSQTSSRPGNWRTWWTEYLRGVMDTFVDPDVEEMWLCKPTQVGGTEAEYNILGYIIEQDPGPTMIVYPTEEFALRMSKTRIQPMIRNCPSLREKYLENDSTDTELHFTDMILVLAWAGSAAALAGMPMRYIILDEVAKYPSNSGKEASPIDLAYERTKTYDTSRKIIGTSTPVSDSDVFFRRRAMADQIWRYYVPCPHCGHEQFLDFRNGVKWPEGCDSADAFDLAWYECESCKARIGDSHKSGMVRSGRWKPFQTRRQSRQVVWMEMNSLVSPWVRIGDMARKFLRVKDYPEELQNFVNSWLGEPWRDNAIELESDLVMERQSEYEAGIVPTEAVLLTAGVDVQHGSLYWTVRAWAPRFTSWNVAHGQCLDWQDLELIMNRPWRKPSGEEFLVSLAAIDSGDQTDDVYDFCAMNSEWAVPVKGSSAPMITPYRISTIDKVGNRAHGQRLIIVDSHQYKTMIANRINRVNGRGAWMVHANCDLDYAEQIVSERREREPHGSRVWYVWRPKVSRAANHYFAAEAYCFCAADLMQVRYLADESEDREPEKPMAEEHKPKPDSGGWLKPKDKW